MKKKLALLLLCALLLPALAFAGDLPRIDRWIFPRLDVETEHCRLFLFRLELEGDAAALAVYYTIPPDVLKERPGMSEDLVFYRMPDAESLEIPQDAGEGERYGPTEVYATDDQERFEGENYSYWIRWDAAEDWPDVLYLRPYDKARGEWGEVLEFWLVDAEHTQSIQYTPAPEGENG